MVTKNKYFVIFLFSIFCSSLLYSQNEPVRKRIKTRQSEPQEKEVKAQSKVERQRSTNDFFGDRLIDRLWFGGNILFGYQEGGTWSNFQIGLTPMVGYKITPRLSVGPRLDISFTSLKILTNEWERVRDFNVGASIFSRYKFLDFLFAHAEVGFENRPFLGRDINGDLIFIDERRNPLLVGLGYNTGGFEFVLLFDLNTPEDSPDQGLRTRFGFTYNF